VVTPLTVTAAATKVPWLPAAPWEGPEPGTSGLAGYGVAAVATVAPYNTRAVYFIEKFFLRKVKILGENGWIMND